MNRKLTASLIILGGIIVYFILIHIISAIASVSLASTDQLNAENLNGKDVKIGISDSIGVTVTRNRWYGKILETSTENQSTRTLYLLGFISIPLESKGTSLLVWNILLIVSIGTLCYFIINRNKHHHYERGYY